MDWDDLQPKKKPAAELAVGQDLGGLSIGELEHRITALEREIERVREELAAKRRHEAAASAIFKS